MINEPWIWCTRRGRYPWVGSPGTQSV